MCGTIRLHARRSSHWRDKSLTSIFHRGLRTATGGVRYLPYTLFDGETAVSNVSVSLMGTVFDGRARRYIQIGTVMTAPAYRGRGLCRFLMESVLRKWRGQCDAILPVCKRQRARLLPKVWLFPHRG